MGSRVSSKGQVTIPQRIRQRLGIRAGDEVDFLVEEGKVIVKPMPERRRSFAEYAGMLPYFKSREEINAWIRELRGDDDPLSP
jgi:AbrB family looped-hinge helix DNA binding protein